MEIEVNNKKYELIKNYKDAFEKEEFLNKYTEYFYNYDYIVGDIAYGKLRLKGFYDDKSKKANNINNFKNIDEYLKKYCAPECKHYILKNINNR